MYQTPPTAIPGFYSLLGIESAIWFLLSATAAILVLLLVTQRGSFRTDPLTASSKLGAPVRSRGWTFLHYALGSLWVLDGFLQLQPAMAGGFAGQVLGPLVSEQPSWLSLLLRWEIYLWQLHPGLLDVATALIQIGLGVSIMFGKSTLSGKIGLWLSIGWAMTIWVGGEALGGSLAPGASEVFGWPGAVAFYAVAAAFLLMSPESWQSGRVSRLMRRAVAATLLLGAVIQGLPFEGFWHVPRASAMISAMASTPQPSLVEKSLYASAQLVSRHPLAWNVVLVITMAVLGVGLLLRWKPSVWSAAAAAFFLVTWWIGQDFGVFGGLGTDPNLSIPILTLLLTERLASAPAISAASASSGAPQGTSGRAMARLLGGMTGLVAIAVGSAPVMLALPAAISLPVSLHVAPPPPSVGTVIPLATLAGEINVYVQASRGRLQVALQSPSTTTQASSASFSLTGNLRMPLLGTRIVRWLGCGPGCYVSPVKWQDGVSRLHLNVGATGWQGGQTSFDIPWPPHPDNHVLSQVTRSMRQVRSLLFRETVTSDTLGSVISYSGHISGQEFLSQEPSKLGTGIQGVDLLGRSGGETRIAFGNLAQGIFVELTIASDHRIISEQLAAPQHLIRGYFRYP